MRTEDHRRLHAGRRFGRADLPAARAEQPVQPVLCEPGTDLRQLDDLSPHGQAHLLPQRKAVSAVTALLRIVILELIDALHRLQGATVRLMPRLSTSLPRALRRGRSYGAGRIFRGRKRRVGRVAAQAPLQLPNPSQRTRQLRPQQTILLLQGENRRADSGREYLPRSLQSLHGVHAPRATAFLAPTRGSIGSVNAYARAVHSDPSLCRGISCGLPELSPHLRNLYFCIDFCG